jgi:predicted CXXCH cytochrome family protein
MRAVHLFLLALLPALAAAGQAPAGKFTSGECVSCHARHEPQLVAAWRASSHARQEPKADCVACHGASHAGAAVRARRDKACTGCHEQQNRKVVHSYATSKHATIVKLQADDWDWSRPLARGYYRAPGCAYCHMNLGEHDTTRSVTRWAPYMSPSGPLHEDTVSGQQTICGKCHAPRYILEQSETGTRMIEIARMKLREARALVESARGSLTAAERRQLDTQLAEMQVHARNVRLGVGHQSPDYQWWHGQPALDGDLLRIRGVIAEARRRSLPAATRR